jgi:peptide/nickel transport system substrate-binding protein
MARMSRIAAALAAPAVLAVVLAGCGSSGSSAASGGASAGVPTGPTAAAAAGKPVEGGNLVIARTQDSQSMNNTTVFDNESIWVFEQMYEPLYTVSSDGKSVVPDLATSYKVSADKKSYTFTLRKGVKFSNGQPMTSKDVVFSLNQSRVAKAGWGYIDTAISSVTGPTPDTVVVNLKFPWAPLLADLSLFSNDIIPANYGGKTETAFYQAPIGTGPFKWDYWHKGQALKLTKNTNYWKPGQPYLDSVTWTDTPSDNTRQLQLQGNQAQVDEFPAWSSVAALKSTPNVTMNLFNSTRTDYMIMNETKKPFNDVHVRRAISEAIDRNAMIKAVLFGNGTPANSFMPPQVPFYDKSTPGLQFNLAAAKKDMAASSVPKGFTTTILIGSGNSDDATRAAILQAELKQIGITLKIQQLDPNTVSTDYQNLDYDMTFTYWTMDIPDPDELVTFAVDPTSGAKSFYTDYNNPTVVAAAHAAEKTLSNATRQTLYNTIQTTAANDAFMAQFYYSPYAYATTSSVKGFFVTPLGNYHLENVWMGNS